MRLPSVLLLLAVAAASAFAQIHPDPVLARMIPPGAVSLLGVRMDQIKTTPMYRKLLEQNKLSDLDRFTRETGFDPRRDVREMLIASDRTQGNSVALARGTFKVTDFGSLKTIRHGIYVIHGNGDSGFCLLDATTAAAGPLPALYAALDHWKSGAAPATPELLAQAERIPASSQIWSVSLGGFSLPGSFTMQQGGPDFAQIFRGVERTVFWANLRDGFDATIEGEVKTEDDAKSLGDAARGLIGLGRLAVPEGHKELLRLWDGFHVEQNARHISITAKVSQDMLDRLVSLLQSGELRRSGSTPL